MYRESEDQVMSDIPSVWPTNGGSDGRPSAECHILTVLSADELASHFPSGENLTLETAFVWPLSVCLRT